MIGDQIAAEAVKNNWQGVVLNGYIRDVTEINDLPISIIAKGSCLLQLLILEDH